MDERELRTRLDAAGYDTQRIDELSLVLKFELMPLLAGWAPVLASLYGPPASPLAVPAERPRAPPPKARVPSPTPRPWWRRLLRLCIGLTEEDP